VPAAAAPAFVNPGVYHRSVGGLLFEWIPTEQVSLDVRPDGKVRILALATKRSFDGRTDCRGRGPSRRQVPDRRPYRTSMTARR